MEREPYLDELYCAAGGSGQKKSETGREDGPDGLQAGREGGPRHGVLTLEHYRMLQAAIHGGGPPAQGGWMLQCKQAGGEALRQDAEEFVEFEPVSPDVLFSAPHQGLRSQSRSRTPQSPGSRRPSRILVKDLGPRTRSAVKRSPSLEGREASPVALLLHLLELQPLTASALFEYKGLE